MREYFIKTKREAEKTKVEQKKELDPYYAAIREFQQDRFALVNAKLRFFKMASLLAMGVILVQAIALAFMSPLKTAVPVLLRVDNNTGYTDVVTPLSNAKDTYQVAETKFNLSQFVINYESYDWQTIQTLNDAVSLMSDGKTFSQYRTQILADNSPLNILKQNNKIKVKVKSVTLLKSDVAQVRFDKAVMNSDGTLSVEYSPTSWVATIAFDFQKTIKTEGERLINPLGFQALSYRVDPEAAK